MSKEQKQPLIFFGHGSPLNAIEDNAFSNSWKEIGSHCHPKAILVISAHWETSGTKVFSGNLNKTIHDFKGFPKELYEINYPAPSNPLLAQSMVLHSSKIEDSTQWGLDHGAWSVLRHAYPKADIPVIQLSLNKNMGVADHFNLAKELVHLRSQGVLIVGSGNMVHNLPKMDRSSKTKYDWAENMENKLLKLVSNKDFKKIVEITSDKDFKLSHPTLEHFLPLVYTFSLVEESETAKVYTPEIVMSSISMASFLIK